MPLPHSLVNEKKLLTIETDSTQTIDQWEAITDTMDQWEAITGTIDQRDAINETIDQ